ncbi:MAG TPA: septation protein A [Thiobacillus sp.]|nr:MAG: septation protein A [Hydrogenophilales bacterium 28-61-11]OYZ57396.1 MAG: septation protein A [Hydrogenophilales bacterium 16-61-112]HQT31004.1 septation protein A [Thiobacillus sp.]HQT69103.1 septation protein A [Thiobacillus sp.]
MKKILFDLFPVIIFFVAYKIGDANAEASRALMTSLGLTMSATEKPGIYLATLVAIIASIGQIGWVKLRGHAVETMMWVSLGIIVVFGGATLWLHDESFIKWKPTVLYWLFGAIILGSMLFGRNVIKSLMGSQMELPDPAWSRLNLSWGGFFIFMGLANLFVAFNFSTDDWVNFKLFGSMGLMLLFVIGQSLMLNKYLDVADQDQAKSNKEENE